MFSVFMFQWCFLHGAPVFGLRVSPASPKLIHIDTHKLQWEPSISLPPYTRTHHKCFKFKWLLLWIIIIWNVCIYLNYYALDGAFFLSIFITTFIRVGEGGPRFSMHEGWLSLRLGWYSWNKLSIYFKSIFSLWDSYGFFRMPPQLANI